ncbi:hypothetical protein P7D58_15225 [Enterococcus avium]|uniref:PTS sugar transporter subunit IIB n=1 Tax=Enterococcus avium TaxID=33945 RepID=UPI00288C6F83|nr:hypothetical protein [Enterococcus avium]MDT2395808.1 hypothetical protein [Enterococcus avium]MDT2420227.1 hypothetical protein [Enterococcus avium]MDT2432329.1 hypothetical protein [Enterococcus avium]MDT2442099.1 hypothetical protein [Enterococcus avium]MDT2455019.1 hypothetical protein [Enterococcus avium]
MREYKVLAICGAGLATSTHVAKILQEGLKKRNLSASIRTCSVGEADGVILNLVPDVIIATVSVDSVKKPENTRVFSGIPLLTGMGLDSIFDEISEYLLTEKG